MDRRRFLASTAAVSACGLAGLGATAGAGEEQGQAGKKYAVRLTVLETRFEKAYADKYRNGQGAPCNKFKVGQEFTVTSPWAMPQGFCEWAWGDIRTYIHLVYGGQSGTNVACCTDGFRPVFFTIERV
jgi:uncharacterized repeat protein (TIGR04076 family)